MIGKKLGERVGEGIGEHSGSAGGSGALTTLTVALTDATDPVITAVNFAYSFVVTNTGAVNATTVSATVTLDASLTFVSGSGTGWSVSHLAGVVTCTRATLAPGAAPTVTITVTTGATALTASSAGNASAANASAATTSTQTTVVKLVTRDATSLKRVPSSLTEWQDFNAYQLAIGTANYPQVLPSSMWLMQEASGNLADGIDSVTLTATGASLIYQQAVTGWSRKAFAIPDGLAAHNAQNTTTAPDVLTTSADLLLYVRMPAAAPAATRRLARINSIGIAANITSGPVIQCITGGVGGSTVSGASNPTGTVRPLEITVDRANARDVIYTDQDKIVGTRGTYLTVALGVGSSGGNSADVGYLVGWLFTGAAAETSDAQRKARQLALGWAPAWT